MTHSAVRRAMTVLAAAAAVWAMRADVGTQAADGVAIFRTQCASCHNGDPASRAPGQDALRSRAPQAVIDALVNGAMRVQGSRMTGAERRAVAEFVTGKPVTGDLSGASTGRCTASARPSPTTMRWAGWSPSATNTRFQPREQAGLTLGDLSHLTVTWAFGFPDAASAWAQPTVAGGRVFVGSQNGTVYSLDAASGCIRWTFSAGGGVRTAIAIGPRGTRSTAYFADTAANAYALDADSGERLWVRRVDDHPLARVTGSPTIFENRLYVPVSSYEEAQGADPQYGCCTFRGNLVALDTADGAIVWKTYMVADAPAPRGTSAAGIQL